MSEDLLLSVSDLSRVFDVSKPWLNRVLEGDARQYLVAVDDASFQVQRGQTFSLVGESGSGKSTIAKMVVGLLEPSDGSVVINGITMTEHGEQKNIGDIRRRIQMIFQDPFASLNPRWRVDRIIAEPIRAFGLETDNDKIDRRVAELLDLVGMSAEDGTKFPHEFSGGQRQRIAIARSLASKPEFIVGDEPTSALDVSVQAQILNLMRDLQDELGLTYLLISHDLSVVRHMSDWIGVMYLGRIVEIAPAKHLFVSPMHPYTRMLLDSVPDLEMSGRERSVIEGEIPNPINPPSGCTFHPRCPLANDRCREEAPGEISRGDVRVRCHAVEEGRI